MTVTLYQIAPSFYSQVVRLALAEKGVPWAERMINLGPVMENYEPWYMRLNPAGVVPTLDHDGKIVTESLAIIRYVDANFVGPKLTPSDFETRARMDAWLEQLSSFPVRELSYGLILMKPIGKLARHTFDLRRKTLRRHMRSSPELAQHYQARLDDIDAWQKISSDPNEVARLEGRLRALLDNIDNSLSHGQPWLMGNQFTLADIWLTEFFARLKQFWVDKTGTDQDRQLPDRIAAYYARLKARPSFKTADIWEGVRPVFMMRMIAPFLLPRLAAATAITAGVVYAAWWLVGLR